MKPDFEFENPCILAVVVNIKASNLYRKVLHPYNIIIEYLKILVVNLIDLAKHVVHKDDRYDIHNDSYETNLLLVELLAQELDVVGDAPHDGDELEGCYLLLEDSLVALSRHHVGEPAGF